MPTGLTLVSASGIGWICSNTTLKMDCVYNAVVMAHGSAPVINLHVAVQPGAQGPIQNVATVTTAFDTNPENDSGSSTAPIIRPSPAPVFSAENEGVLIALLLLLGALGLRQLRPREQR
jgi:hypothetical protein